MVEEDKPGPASNDFTVVRGGVENRTRWPVLALAALVAVAGITQVFIASVLLGALTIFAASAVAVVALSPAKANTDD